MILVFNASPLIILAKAGLLDTVLGLAKQVIIPQAVADEINRVDDPSDAASLWLGTDQAATLLCPTPTTSAFVAAWDLGEGESAVISLAQTTPGATAILDDLAARHCAQALGLKVIGTLGLILQAKKAGFISSVIGPLEAIVAAGLFIAPRHLSDIRQRAGE